VVKPALWSLWSMPRHVAAYILGIDLAAVGLTAALLAAYRPASHDLVMMAVIIALGMVNTEISRHIERMRRRFADTPHVNLTSVWTMPPRWFCPRASRPRWSSCCTSTCGTQLVSGQRCPRLPPDVQRGDDHLGVRRGRCDRPERGSWRLPDPFGTGIAVGDSPRNTGVLRGELGAGGRRYRLGRAHSNLRRTLGSWNENAIEYATLCLGVLTAALLDWKPLLVAMFIPALHILHRSILVRQFEQAATTDPKTVCSMPLLGTPSRPKSWRRRSAMTALWGCS